jgi:small subunit ribosomal protein S6
MLLLDPHTSEEQRSQVVAEVRSTIESQSNLLGSYDWGQRELAFEIDDRAEAIYHLFQFSGDSEVLKTLDHDLKLAEGVLRFRTLRIKPNSPLPATPQQTDSQQEESRRESTVAARAAADAPRAEE